MKAINFMIFFFAQNRLHANRLVESNKLIWSVIQSIEYSLSFFCLWCGENKVESGMARKIGEKISHSSFIMWYGVWESCKESSKPKAERDIGKRATEKETRP